MLMCFNLGVLFVLVFMLMSVCLGETLQPDEIEAAIIRRLFLDDLTLTETNRIVRPPGLHNSSDPVEMHMGYALLGINSFNELTGDISLHIWEYLSWTDPRLTWNESLQSINVPASYVWRPDIALSEPGSKEKTSTLLEEKVYITSNGDVVFYSARNFNFRCNMDIHNFPYDTQQCNITFGLWSYSADEVDIQTSRDGITNYKPHSDWLVTDYSLTIHNMVYAFSSSRYQSIEMMLKLERRPMFYFCIFIAPVLVLFCALPIIHLFPPGCSQKTTLAGLLLVCIMLLHYMLYQQIGGFAEEKTPHLLRQYQFLMAMILVSICVSSLTSTLANAVNTSRRVPAVIRKVMSSVVGRICCFRAADLKGEFTQIEQTSTVTGFDPHNDLAPIVNDDGNSPGQQTSSSLTQLTEELRYGRERRQLEMEWYQLALLVDRLFAVIFLLYIIIGSAIMESH